MLIETRQKLLHLHQYRPLRMLVCLLHYRHYFHDKCVIPQYPSLVQWRISESTSVKNSKCLTESTTSAKLSSRASMHQFYLPSSWHCCNKETCHLSCPFSPRLLQFSLSWSLSVHDQKTWVRPNCAARLVQKAPRFEHTSTLLEQFTGFRYLLTFFTNSLLSALTLLTTSLIFYINITQQELPTLQKTPSYWLCQNSTVKGKVTAHSPTLLLDRGTLSL